MSHLANFPGTPPLLPIVRPDLPELNDIAIALRQTLQSRIVTNGGPRVCELERRLGQWLQVPTLAFCNGEQALITLLLAAGVQGGEVILPSFTFAGTAHAVVLAGARPVFAEIQSLERPLLDAADVERRITANTVAILAVDAYGFACDYAALEALAGRHRLRLFIDSAPAFGTRTNGCLTGGHGDGQIFSFHASKPFSTIEGGCLCSHDRALLQRAAAIRNFGQDEQGNCTLVGLNGKMSEVNAIIGLTQLDRLDPALQRRREAASYLQRGLRGIPGLHPCVAADGEEPVWQYLPVRVDASDFGIDREQLLAHMQQAGVMLRRYYAPACHQFPAYADTAQQNLSLTEHLAREVVALPIYNDMREEECERILCQLRLLHLQHAPRAQQGEAA
jgi:dTDP-4-amino-4,6-dideoxyglucose